MAPIFANTLLTAPQPPTFPIIPQPNSQYMYPYPSLTHIFHVPAPSPSLGGIANSAASSSSATPAADTKTVTILLVFAIFFAFLGTTAIVWVYYRRRTHNSASRSVSPKMVQSWDSRQRFWVKNALLPSPALIADTEKTTQNALLKELPNAWRILGRTNVAMHDDYEDAIPEYCNKSERAEHTEY